jgi:cyclase
MNLAEIIATIVTGRPTLAVMCGSWHNLPQFLIQGEQAMRQARLFIFAFAMMSSALTAFGQSMDEVEIVTHPVADGVYMLAGQGGNIGLVATSDGAFLIDDQFAPLTDRILAAVAEVTDQPVKFVLNTHWHFDHTGGNENLADAGVMVVAHDNVRQRLAAGQFMEFFGREVAPAPDGALPVVTFNDSITFHMGEHAIHAFHVANAHTDGDAIIHLAKADVIHAGDVVFYGLYPFIDAGSGGSLDGMIAAVGQMLDLAGEKTRIIPGHGPVIDRDQLADYGEMLQTVRSRLVERMEKGQSLTEIQADGITAEWDDGWGGGFIPPDRWVEMLYRSLKSE